MSKYRNGDLADVQASMIEVTADYISQMSHLLTLAKDIIEEDKKEKDIPPWEDRGETQVSEVTKSIVHLLGLIREVNGGRRR